MNPSSRSLLSTVALAVAAMGSTTFVIAACGSSTDSTFKDGEDGSTPGFDTDGGLGNAKPDSGDPFATDPPPKYCVLPGQTTPPKPGGTEACPDDKNKPGCGCTTLGEEAACWTGLRVNRSLGQCKDGRTKCVQIDENTKAWGPCEGEVLPSAGQTKGKAACKCFSLGQWKLANTSPCFITYGAPNSGTYAVSTVTDGTGSGGKPVGESDCPTIPQSSSPPPAKPGSDWSTDTLKVDCAGHFKLCYELKAGKFETPLPSDCSLTKVCVEADYVKENVEQTFPPLPAWTSPNSACAAQWDTTGGYGEMTVVGESVLCDKVDDGAGNAFVFNRVKYCPSTCRDAGNAGKPECMNCQQGGSGTF
ncbi:hypothetical protein BH11MYX4_BH11MYX4_17100 [soil metagenome]